MEGQPSLALVLEAEEQGGQNVCLVIRFLHVSPCDCGQVPESLWTSLSAPVKWVVVGLKMITSICVKHQERCLGQSKCSHSVVSVSTDREVDSPAMAGRGWRRRHMLKTSWWTNHALPGQISSQLSVLYQLGPKAAAPRRLWMCCAGSGCPVQRVL